MIYSIAVLDYGLFLLLELKFFFALILISLIIDRFLLDIYKCWQLN